MVFFNIKENFNKNYIDKIIRKNKKKLVINLIKKVKDLNNENYKYWWKKVKINK